MTYTPAPPGTYVPFPGTKHWREVVAWALHGDAVRPVFADEEPRDPNAKRPGPRSPQGRWLR